MLIYLLIGNCDIRRLHRNSELHCAFDIHVETALCERWLTSTFRSTYNANGLRARISGSCIVCSKSNSDEILFYAITASLTWVQTRSYSLAYPNLTRRRRLLCISTFHVTGHWYNRRNDLGKLLFDLFIKLFPWCPRPWSRQFKGPNLDK